MAFTCSSFDWFQLNGYNMRMSAETDKIGHRPVMSDGEQAGPACQFASHFFICSTFPLTSMFPQRTVLECLPGHMTEADQLSPIHSCENKIPDGPSHWFFISHKRSGAASLDGLRYLSSPLCVSRQSPRLTTVH